MYKDIIREGDICRAAYKDGIEVYIKRLEAEGDSNRETFMPTENFINRIEEYRSAYIGMLGIDRISSDSAPEPAITSVGEDEYAVIYRVTTYITREIPPYGLLYVPHGIKRAPLIIAQHGGGGTPELCSDINGKNNYNHMVRRILKRGAAVFAPQLLLWNFREQSPTQPSHPIPYNRLNIDNNMKRFGMSITALEIKGIMNAITFLSVLPYVDNNKIAMTGLSYGGYYTLHTMAADTRIKVGFSNACFNSRNAYPWVDMSYPNSGNTFHDAEVAALCAPRKLYIAVGKEDTVFNYESAIPEAERAKRYFCGAGCPQNFVFRVWDGGHTLPFTNEGFDFIFSAFEE
ncbi:MAG: dienelactone hydrolase family protein [Clostridia bacterium]|nr:dienelactone hydrolase family protein [Clostridia bacterium]